MLRLLGRKENPVDAISGATLADTAGYINAVVAAAQELESAETMREKKTGTAFSRSRFLI